MTPFFPKRLEGREEIRKHYRAVWGASPIRLTEIREIACHETRDPQVIVAEAAYSAVATTTNKTFELSFALVMRVEGGLIVELRDYMDALGAAVAVDRLPNLVGALARGNRS